MNVSREEAREALDAVRRIESQTRRLVAGAGGGAITMAWGMVWIVGYLGSHFLEDAAIGLVWAVAVLAGVAATLAIAARENRRVRSPLGPRIGTLWLALWVFTSLWIWLSQPLTYPQMSLLIALAAMFGYVVMGLWLDTIFITVGLTVAAASIAGYFLVPAYFALWMAVLGGGTLLGSGLYIERRWR